MKETTIEDIEEKARLWHAQGKAWHFHMLPGDCVFNERSGHYAFMLENRTDDETYVVYWSERGGASDSGGRRHSDGASSAASYTAIDLPQKFMELGEELVTIQYGEDILDEGTGSTESTNEQMRAVLQKARDLNERGVYWHCHLLFPDCALNKHGGKWNIAFECKATGDFVEVLYDDDPVDDLNRIEVLYYEQKG